VVGIGNAVVDVIAPVEEKFLLDHSIGKGVMTLIDEHRAHALYAALTNTREIGGGSAANTMAGIASLGGNGVYIGKVKQDRLGEAFRASMREIGVHFTTPFSTEGPSTALCVVAVTPDEHRSMSTYLGAAHELSVADIKEDEIAASEILYIEGYIWDAAKARSTSICASSDRARAWSTARPARHPRRDGAARSPGARRNARSPRRRTGLRSGRSRQGCARGSGRT